VSEPSCRAGAQLPNIVMLYLEPAQGNSVLALKLSKVNVIVNIFAEQAARSDGRSAAAETFFGFILRVTSA